MINEIVAYDKNRVIGADNQLLWRIPEDMNYFKEKTTGNSCVMGKNTWRSIPDKYRPLPGRFNVIVTSRGGIEEVPNEIAVANSLDSAIRAIRMTAQWSKRDIFLTGGESIYRAGLEQDIVNRIYATEVHTEVDVTGRSDVRYFPKLDPREWKEIWREDHFDAKIPYSFVIYERRRN